MGPLRDDGSQFRHEPRNDALPIVNVRLSEQPGRGQGLTLRPSSHRQSASYCRKTHTGLPIAPARCATDVSDEMTRSTEAMIAAASPKSSIASSTYTT
jgi:hypothetical protein